MNNYKISKAVWDPVRYSVRAFAENSAKDYFQNEL
jgi:hypothetical protein